MESIIIVGSCARGTNTETSDLDLCVITTNRREPSWISLPLDSGTYKVIVDKKGYFRNLKLWS